MTASVYPVLRYADAPSAIEWLCKAFGFEELLVIPAEDGMIAHAELRLGDGIIMLGSVHPDGEGARIKTPQEVGAATQGIYVTVGEVDDHYERAKAMGAQVVRELQDTEYGSREYTVRDLEGNFWSFGTYRPTEA